MNIQLGNKLMEANVNQLLLRNSVRFLLIFWISKELIPLFCKECIWIDSSHLKTRCVIPSFTFNWSYWIWKVKPVKPNIPFSNILMIWSYRNWERLLNAFKAEFFIILTIAIQSSIQTVSLSVYVMGNAGKVVKLWKAYMITGSWDMSVADSIHPKYWMAASGR